MNCALCKAVNDEYRLVCEDEFSFCIVCKAPLKEGHVMVLPRKHVRSFSELDEEEAKSFLDMLGSVKNALAATYSEEIICFQNHGKHSTEEHVHIHLLPSKGGLRDLVAGFEGVPLRQDNSDEEKRKVKDSIRKQLR